MCACECWSTTSGGGEAAVEEEVARLQTTPATAVDAPAAGTVGSRHDSGTRVSHHGATVMYSVEESGVMEERAMCGVIRRNVQSQPPPPRVGYPLLGSHTGRTLMSTLKWDRVELLDELAYQSRCA